MTRVLCVAEKPSIAKAITQILSGGRFIVRDTRCRFIKNYDFDYQRTNSQYTVTAVAGHLTEIDFPDTHRKWNSCDPYDLFDAPILVDVKKENKPMEINIFNEAKNANTLMIWTDCDREGEHIGSEIANVARRARAGITVKRARFSAIVAQQIHHAAQNPVQLDMRLVHAVEARILIDLKIGAAFTRYQTFQLQNHIEKEGVISYGPCQFPALGFVVSRFKDVRDFRPETFWYIHLALTTDDGQETVFNWKRGHLFFEDEAIVLYMHVLDNPRARVSKVEKKETKKWKPLPLTTVELQKAGSRLLKLSPKKVLDIAEKLYQQGFVSYPRTETDQYDPQFDFHTLIEKQTVDGAWGDFATSLQNGEFSAPRKGKNNDKAHPPIHPTAHAANLAGDDKKVYEYISRRFLASCSKDAKGWQTTVEVICGDEYFSATGLTVTEKNYLLVYPYEKWNTNELPDFEEGNEFEPSVCELRDGQTSKPTYLTEADLVALMDKNGIGTDATIAQHIDTIIAREYVIEQYEGQTKYLLPSTLGIGLIDGYNKMNLNNTSLGKPLLRRETERRMVRVGRGETTKEAMIHESLEQYRAMYIIVRREFDKVRQCVRQYLDGARNQPAGGGGDNEGGAGAGRGGRGGGARGRGRGGAGAGRAGRDGHGGDESDGDGDGPGPGAGGGRIGRGSGMRGTSSRGRANQPQSRRNETPMDIDADNDHQPNPPPKSSSSHGVPKPPTSSTVPRPITTSTTTRAPTIAAATRKAITIRFCQCSKPAVEQCNTAGKKYLCCGSNKCHMFEWVETLPPRPVSPPLPRATSNSHTGFGSEVEPPLCNCNIPAARRTVVKENENKGRKFWTCGNERACQFFQFLDEPQSNVPVKRTYSNTAENTGESSNQSATADACYKCGEGGHWAAQCPSEGGPAKKSRSGSGSQASTSQSGSGSCFKCGEAGHWMSQCPNDTDSGARSRSFGNSATNIPSSATCFKCNQTGHFSNSCPNPNGTSSKSTRGGSGKGSSGGRGGRGTRGGGRGRGRGKGTTKTKSGFTAPAGF
ncbi:prokaryotic type I DNA topoisomerase [Marasmius fiardii PR-910]|nr:prokaryotic type I DNA topoisomerase [Marasmius fiardii PR-910]